MIKQVKVLVKLTEWHLKPIYMKSELQEGVAKQFSFLCFNVLITTPNKVK